MGWQPIETAPKDGTSVLLCKAIDADGEQIDWRDDLHTAQVFVQVAAWWSGDEAWIVYGDQIAEPRLHFEPTHWMPLPASPALAAVRLGAEALLTRAIKNDGAVWHDKRVFPADGGEPYQHWEVSVWLPVPLSQPDKSPEAALRRAISAAHADPAPVALTNEQLADLCEAWLRTDGRRVSNVVDAFEAGYRVAERAHGINEKEGEV